MDERDVRSDTGHDGAGTYRVDLTRHCLTSGIVQLPFALRDRIPEGDLVCTDVERDATLSLQRRPPRNLAGFGPFFEAHGLGVNDAVEFRLAEGEVRVAPVRRARPSERRHGEAGPFRSSWRAFLAEQEPVRSARGSYAGPSRAAPAQNDAATAGAASGSGTAHDPERTPAAEPAGAAAVLERIGSVTVRRLGRTDLPGPVPSEPVPSEPVPSEPVPSEPVPYQPARSEPASSEPAAPATIAASAPGASPAPGPPPTDAPLDVDDAMDDLQNDPRNDPSDEDRQEDAPATSPDDVRSPTAREGRGPRPSARTPQRSRPHAYGVRPVRRDEPVVTEQDLADPEERRPRMVLGPPRPVHERERERQERVSRDGDLRSRIVRWLLDPTTPVIVPFDRVESTFGLDADVAADVMNGIVEEPPPSLRLTPLREGIVRVSRVTVSVED